LTGRVVEISKKTSYIFTQKQLKEILGLEGDISNIGLWRGLSPNEEAQGKSHDIDTYEFVTVSTTKQNVKPVE
jgi:hypothetical protein